MMRKFWDFIGRIGFWCAWPIIFACAYFTTRTRVVIQSGENIVLVRGWLSNGKWMLPGGGLRLREVPAAGAAREVKEEIGLEIPLDKLKHVYTKRVTNGSGLSYKEVLFTTQLDGKAQFRLPPWDIIEIAWFKNQALIKSDTVDSQVRQLVRDLVRLT